VPEIGFMAIALIIAACVSGMVLVFVLWADRGFEYCDEGLLLSTSSGCADLNGMPIFDYLYTGRLLSLVRSDVARLRLASLALSLSVAAAFAATFIHLSGALGFPVPGGFWPSIAVFGYFATVSFLRVTLVPPSPGYGILAGLACTLGVILALAAAASSGIAAALLGLLAGAVLSVLLFTRLTGAPLVAVLLCVLAGLIARQPLALVLWLAAGGAGGILLHLALLISPRTALDRIRSALEMQKACATERFGTRAMLEADSRYALNVLLVSLKSRWYFLAAMAAVPTVVPESLRPWAVPFLILASCGFFLVKNHKAMDKVQPNEALVMRLFPDILWLVCAYRLGAMAAPLSSDTAFLPQLGLSLLLMAFALGHSLLSWHLTMRNTHFAAELWASPPLLMALGTNGEVGEMIAMCVMLVGASHVLLRFRSGWLAYPLAFGHEMPRRVCDTPVEAGGPGNTLRLPAEHVRFIEDLRGAARRAGFRPGDPVMPCFNLLGFAWLLGGRMPWVPNYILHPETVNSAGLGRWIGEMAPEEAARAFILEFHSDETAPFLCAMGLDFPAGYERCFTGWCPMTGRTATLWKPGQEER
jgi:hypothetical protein